VDNRRRRLNSAKRGLYTTVTADGRQCQDNLFPGNDPNVTDNYLEGTLHVDN